MSNLWIMDQEERNLTLVTGVQIIDDLMDDTYDIMGYTVNYLPIKLGHYTDAEVAHDILCEIVDLLQSVPTVTKGSRKEVVLDNNAVVYVMPEDE